MIGRAKAILDVDVDRTGNRWNKRTNEGTNGPSSILFFRFRLEWARLVCGTVRYGSERKRGIFCRIGKERTAGWAEEKELGGGEERGNLGEDGVNRTTEERNQ